MDLLAALPELKRWDFRILATDIDTNVIAKAAGGVYPESELNGLSRRAGARCSSGPATARSASRLAARELMSFKPLNLMSRPGR